MKWLRRFLGLNKKELKVIIEDDDPILRFMASEALKSEGFVLGSLDESGNLYVEYSDGTTRRGVVNEGQFEENPED